MSRPCSCHLKGVVGGVAASAPSVCVSRTRGGLGFVTGGLRLGGRSSQQVRAAGGAAAERGVQAPPWCCRGQNVGAALLGDRGSHPPNNHGASKPGCGRPGYFWQFPKSEVELLMPEPPVGTVARRVRLVSRVLRPAGNGFRQLRETVSSPSPRPISWPPRSATRPRQPRGAQAGDLGWTRRPQGPDGGGREGTWPWSPGPVPGFPAASPPRAKVPGELRRQIFLPALRFPDAARTGPRSSLFPAGLSQARGRESQRRGPRRERGRYVPGTQSEPRGGCQVTVTLATLASPVSDTRGPVLSYLLHTCYSLTPHAVLCVGMPSSPPWGRGLGRLGRPPEPRSRSKQTPEPGLLDPGI